MTIYMDANELLLVEGEYSHEGEYEGKFGYECHCPLQPCEWWLRIFPTEFTPQPAHVGAFVRAEKKVREHIADKHPDEKWPQEET